MRDPNRLDKFYEEMRDIHKEKWPDIRFGQLMSNFFGWLYTTYGIDIFFPEEPEMIQYFKEYANSEEIYYDS